MGKETSDSRRVVVESMHALYTWLFLTIAARVPIFGFTAYSICHDFIYSTYIYNEKKKEEKRCDGNATRSRCALHTRATHARIRMRAHIHIGARAHWYYHFTDDIPYREFIALEVQRRTTKIRSRMLKREEAT